VPRNTSKIRVVARVLEARQRQPRGHEHVIELLRHAVEHERIMLIAAGLDEIHQIRFHEIRWRARLVTGVGSPLTAINVTKSAFERERVEVAGDDALCGLAFCRLCTWFRQYSPAAPLRSDAIRRGSSMPRSDRSD